LIKEIVERNKDAPDDRDVSRSEDHPARKLPTTRSARVETPPN